MVNEELLQEELESHNSQLIKDNYELLMQVLDCMYLTQDNYANDCFMRDDVLKAMEEVLDGSYKNHKACYNCQKKNNCKYKNFCKAGNPLSSSSKDYFEKEYRIK